MKCEAFVWPLLKYSATVLEMQRNEDFTFDRITKNYNKYFRGPKENETKYE